MCAKCTALALLADRSNRVIAVPAKQEPSDPLGVLNVPTPRTQKLTGLMALKTNDRYNVKRLPVLALLSTMEEFEELKGRVTFEAKSLKDLASKAGFKQLFGRPCPLHPRHGFVDSRIVKNAPDVRELLQLAKAADPEAELAIAPFVEPYMSAVWRPGLMAIGPGHDGATAGRDSIAVPLGPLTTLASHTLNWIAQQKKEAHIKDADDLFIEMVFARHDCMVSTMSTSPIVVQSRGGPKIAGISGTRYVPKDVTVTDIITPTEGMDLLEWEALMSSLNGHAKGTVVWHPGGNMASHFAIHAVLNEIPVICSDTVPSIGSTLKAETTTPPMNYAAVLAGLGAGMAIDIRHNLTPSNAKDFWPKGQVKKRHRIEHATQHAVQFLASVLHSTTRLGGDDGFWLGAAIAVMHRLGTTAALGESRHGTPSQAYHPLMQHETKKAKDKPLMYSTSREQVYEAYLSRPWHGRAALATCSEYFEKGKWNGGSVGGSKWHSCTAATVKLDHTISAFAKEPSKGTLAAMIKQFNVAVNMAHWNGWWLNKFAAQYVLDDALAGYPVLSIAAAPFYWELHRIAGNAKTRRYAKRWATSRRATVMKPPPKFVYYLGASGEEKAAMAANMTVDEWKAHSAKALEEKIAYQKKQAEWSAKVKAEQAEYMDKALKKLDAMKKEPPKPVTTGTTITAAQAKLNGAKVHIQYKTSDMVPGVYATKDIIAPYSQKLVISKGTTQSWCEGSNTKTYLPLLIKGTMLYVDHSDWKTPLLDLKSEDLGPPVTKPVSAPGCKYGCKVHPDDAGNYSNNWITEKDLAITNNECVCGHGYGQHSSHMAGTCNAGKYGAGGKCGCPHFMNIAIASHFGIVT